ncbi:MAG: adenosine deaminase [Pseudomonadota bacterium]
MKLDPRLKALMEEGVTEGMGEQIGAQPGIVRSVLKAELHCHLEGAAEPSLVERLARKHKVDVSSIIRDGRYVWNHFTAFLNTYDVASTVFRDPEDYRLLTYDYFARLAEQNAIYGEVFASPDHAAEVGLSYEDLISAISDGIDAARREHGVEGRIIVTCIRHLGPDRAERVARLVANNPHPMVTGWGMAGDERMFEPADFADAFEIAADAGLGLTCHAGEFAGPASIEGALDNLFVSRIGHGVRAAESPELLERLSEEDMVLEVCPGSNIDLGLYADMAAHPLSRLVEAGLRLTLNSDDPPFFHTSLENEYALANSCGLDAEDLLQFTRTALEAAFVDETTRSKLLRRLDNAD